MAPHELDRPNLRQLATVVLTRPLRMMASELIVTTTCAYLALCYAVFYMTFQAFPLVFQGLHGLSPGACGLAFLSIGVGSLAALPLFWWYDAYLARARARGDPWTAREEYRRVPLACLGGPLFVVSLFWLGWTARAEISFVVPMLAGIPFGMGFMREFAVSFLLLLLLSFLPSISFLRSISLYRPTLAICFIFPLLVSTYGSWGSRSSSHQLLLPL